MRCFLKIASPSARNDIFHGILLLIIFVPSFLFASGKGTTTSAFLKLGVGARGLGMGEAYTTQSRGIESLFWNPAGLQGKDKTSVFLSYNPIIQKTHFSQAALSIPVGGAALGMGYSGVSYQSIDSYDDVGNKLGRYQAQDQLGIVGFAAGPERFKFGMSLKYVRSTIDDVSADAVAGDAGLLFSNPLIRSMKHALLAGNVGSQMSFLDEKEELPLKFVFGTGLALGRKVDLAFDFSHIKGQGGIFSGGFEWRPFGDEVRSFAMRGGYTSKRNEMEKLSGLSAGAGFNFSGLNLDYAWIPYGELGDSHAFTIFMKFSGERKPQKDPALPRGSNQPAGSSASQMELSNGDRVLIILNSGETLEGDLVEEQENRFLIRTQGRKVQIFKRDILKSRKIQNTEIPQ